MTLTADQRDQRRAAGKRMRARRWELQIGLRDMARRAKVSTTYLAMLEQGRRSLTGDGCRRALRILGMDAV